MESISAAAPIARPGERNYCYGCGVDNPDGMRLEFNVDADKREARGTFNIDERYQGPPSFVHGGIIATLVDEAMAKLNKPDGIVGVTAELSVEYLKPVPLRDSIIVEARSSEQRGRHYWRECTIRDSKGTLLVRGRGRFVKIADREERAAAGG
jgi:uncharacterized protein (TIGR00369 family)